VFGMCSNPISFETVAALTETRGSSQSLQHPIAGLDDKVISDSFHIRFPLSFLNYSII
jgi:hypothetical protein